MTVTSEIINRVDGWIAFWQKLNGHAGTIYHDMRRSFGIKGVVK